MKTRTLRTPLAALPLVFLPAFLPFAALAQGTSVTTLPETVVTATRNPLPLTAAMHHTTVISREDIERSQASDLVSLLQREAGLQRTQNGGVGTVSSVFLRGAPSLQTLVLVDGVPLNKQDASGAVSLEHLMLDNVERVEIVRGNVSAIYGSGAIGGVIQIFTRTAEREPSAQLSVELGPRSTRKLSAQVSTQVGDTAISAGASRFRTDGFSSVDPGQFAGANPDVDGYANTSLNLSLTHQLAPRHQVGLRLSRSVGDTAYDNAYGAATDVQTSSTRISQATLFTDNTWGDWRSRVSLSEQSDRSRTSDNGFFGSDDGFRTGATVLSWVNTVALGGNWLATAGLERQWQRVTTETTSAFGTPYDARRNAAAWFGGVEGGIGPGSLQVNLRLDRVGELDETTYYLGYSVPVTKQLKLLASTSTAFNAPPLGYLFAPGFGNPDLKPETARSQELGLQYEQGSHLLRATWFKTRVTDQLDYDSAAFRFANLGRTRNRGLEMSYQGTLGQTRLRASLTLQEPENEITGVALTRRAKTLWSLGASQTLAGLALDADLRHTGRRNDQYADPITFATLSTSLPSHTVLDLAASYAFRSNLKLRARIDNVTDQSYQTVYGYNQQPRSLYLGLDWRPKF
ncbi:TonB-dependent receptor [Hydrogenophaga sp.]|uniref:TonB-dependent receptor plug domain-containing protein n=1 Tax=Hydrogenophaga sp. TaxID=1904254 RepID=UPI0025BC4129|nr:TonB-dependent receptor [Hydrogenophaga sp.]